MRPASAHTRAPRPYLRLFLICATAFFLLVGCTAHGAQIYRWVDANGTIHYSQSPTQQQPFQTLEAAGQSPSSETAGSVQGDESTPSPAGQTPAGESDQARPQTVAFDHGLLWKISNPHSTRAAPSYLFGTIHSEDPRVLHLPPKVQTAFDESAHFCTEVVFDAQASLVLAQSMLFSNGQNLRAVIGERLFSKVAVLMADHRVPEQSLLQMKPWAVLTVLSSPKKKSGQFLDMALYERARQQGKSTCGLETAKEQATIFNAAPVEDQVLLLRETVRQYPRLPDFFARLMDRYLARDLAGLVALSEENSPTDAAVKRVYEAFMTRLLDRRNPRMLTRMTAILQEGGAFIAVGALHLPGEQGLLQLLYQQGYALEAVY